MLACAGLLAALVPAVPQAASAAAGDPMVLVFDLSKDEVSGRNEPLAVYVPLYGTVNATIDWGDGSPPTTVNRAASFGHTYAAVGTYNVSITGTVTQYGQGQGSTPEYEKLVGVLDFGDLGTTSLNGAFNYAKNLVDVPDTLPSTVTDLTYLFGQATAFNDPDVGAWDVSNVTRMAWTFYYLRNFNQPLGSWDVSNVTDMRAMFAVSTKFNQNLNSWDVSKVTNMSSMFSVAESYNQPMNNWDVSNVTNMSSMFEQVYSLNQDLSSWNTSKVTSMGRMFYFGGNPQGIGAWDTSKVTSMGAMFLRGRFSGDISTWDTSSLADMSAMFWGTRSFGGNIAPWNVTKVTTADNLWKDSGTSTANYDALLQSWSAQSVRSGVPLTAGNSRYSCNGVAGRETLTSAPKNWSITDGGQTNAAQPPVITSVSPGSGELTVTFTPPTCIAGTIDNYEYSTNNGSTWTAVSPVSTDETFVITGLTNGTTYPVRVRAVVDGTPQASNASLPRNGTPQPNDTVPEPPTDVEAVAGDGSATVAWMAPIDDGGAAITSYTVRALVGGNPAGPTCTVTISSPDDPLDCTVTGLVNGTNYTFDVVATNSVGNSAPSAASPSVRPSGDADMVLEFDTTLDDGSGGAPNEVSVELGGDVLATIAWGDGTFDEVDEAGLYSHTYATAGDYTVTINGRVPSFGGPSSGNDEKLTAVTSFGRLGTTGFPSAFSDAVNLTDVPADLPSGVTTTSGMFSGATSFDDGDVGSWDVGSVTDMSSMFDNATSFDQDLSGWDVGSVTDMSRMFAGAEAFNGAVGTWNTGSVTSMSSMFESAPLFNQDISGWDTSSVTDMSYMFADYSGEETPSTFDQPIGSWDTSNVESMASMFENAVAFDQDLGAWDIGNVVDLSDFLLGGGLSIDNYDALLIGWGTQADGPGVQADLSFDAGESQFSCAAAEYHDTLLDAPNNWEIADGGPSDAPGPPTILGVEPGDRTLEVIFVAGCPGATPTEFYEVSLDGGEGWGRLSNDDVGPFVIGDLVNGQTYPVEIRAIAVFPGPASQPVDGTPQGPDVPPVPPTPDEPVSPAFTG